MSKTIIKSTFIRALTGLTKAGKPDKRKCKHKWTSSLMPCSGYLNICDKCGKKEMSG